VPCDLAREILRGCEWIVGHPGDQSEPVGFPGAQDACGEGQFLGHVDRHQAWQRLGERHVGDQPPLDLAHRQASIRMGDADVGSQRDLQPAP
jgi:hypothetical protein